MNDSELFIKNYNANQYERPSVTVDMLLFTVEKNETPSLKVLLIKRKNHPEKDKWAIPGGFVDMDEGLDEAALRELKEETNIENIYMEQIYTFGDTKRDPRTRVISVAYMALVDYSRLNVKAGDDAKEAKWFSISIQFLKNIKNGNNQHKLYKLIISCENLSMDATIEEVYTLSGNQWMTSHKIIESNGIAFDHAKILFYGIKRLRKDVNESDAVFRLLPDTFTLDDLLKIYETILEQPLLKDEFTPKVLPKVIKVNDQYYRFNPLWQEANLDEK